MIKKLLSMNGLAILGAVLYHAAGWGFISMFWWADRYRDVNVPDFQMIDSFSYFGLRTIEQLIIFAIPVFLFVSGYFVAFASGKDAAPKWSWIFTRIKYLLIPYILWSAMMTILNVAFGESYTFRQLAGIFLTGKAVEAFYFIPLIIQLYLLAPLLTPIARRKPLTLLLISFILLLLVRLGQYAALSGIDYPFKQTVNLFLPSWIFPGNLFWMTLGLTVAFHYKSISQVLARWRWLFLMFVILLIPLGILEWEALFELSGQNWIASRETLLDNFYSLFMILAFLSFSMTAIVKQKWLSALGSKSFAIYLSHSLFLTLTAKGIYHLLPSLFQYQVVFQAILIAAAILGPLILIEIVRRTWLNRFYVYIFG